MANFAPPANGASQASANRGPDLRFVVEANFKLLMPKSNRGLILIFQFRANMNVDFYPGSNLLKYHYAYMNTDSCKDHFI